MLNGMSEQVDQLAIAITTIVFNRTAMAFAGEDGIVAEGNLDCSAYGGIFDRFYIYRLYDFGEKEYRTEGKCSFLI